MEVAGKEEDKEQKDKIREGGSTSKKPVIFNGPLVLPSTSFGIC